MGAEVYIDTAFVIALLRSRDAHHSAARALAASLASRRPLMVTTDAVLLEIANYFARLPQRAKSIDWIAAIRRDPNWSIVPLEAALIARGEARYRRFSDKSWSLTDCIGMEVMQQRGIREAATTDRGFGQAGFEVLL